MEKASFIKLHEVRTRTAIVLAKLVAEPEDLARWVQENLPPLEGFARTHMKSTRTGGFNTITVTDEQHRRI